MTNAITLSRWLRATPERVFAAFASPDALQSWIGPVSCTVPRASVDLRVGGRYRIEMHGSSGDVYVVAGEDLAVEPPSRLVFTWQWQNRELDAGVTTVSVRLSAEDGGARLDRPHDGFADDGAAGSHDEGWQSRGSPSSSGCASGAFGSPPSMRCRQSSVVACSAA